MYALLKVQKCAQNNFKYSMLTKYASIERNCRHTRRTFLTLGIQKNQYVCPQFARIYYSSIQENLPRQKIRAGRSQRTNHVSMTHITEVTSSSTTDKDAKLVRYNPNQFAEFAAAGRPSKMPKTIEMSPVAVTPCDIGTIPSAQVNPEEIEEIEEIAEAIEDVPMDIADAKRTMKVKDKTLIKANEASTSQKKLSEAKQLALDRAIFNNLQAFLNVCCSNDWTNSAMNILLKYHKSHKNSRIVELFQIILNNFASKGNLKKMSEILNVLHEDNIPLTPQIYAAVFECLGRRPLTPHNTELHKFQKQAESEGIPMNRILDESRFVRDQREMVLNAIKLIDPDFQPVYTAPDILYKNHLVNALNANVDPIHPHVPPAASVGDANDSSITDNNFSHEAISQMMNSQLENELKGTLTIESICKVPPNVQAEIKNNHQKIEDLFKGWRVNIIKSFKRDLNSMHHHNLSRGFNAININPYMRTLNIEQFVDILIEEVKYLAKSSMSYTPTTTQLYSELGKKVLTRYQIEMRSRNGLIQKTGRIYEQYCNELLNGNSKDNARQIWQRLEYKALEHGPSLDLDNQLWPPPVTQAIGKFLYNILLRDLKIDITINQSLPKREKSFMVPVFYTLLRFRDKMLREEVKVHPVFSNLYRNHEKGSLTVEINFMPMLCPPLPWTNAKNGAYLATRSELIRLPYQAAEQLDRIRSAPETQLYPVLDSLNLLANVPWKINTRILDILIEVFNAGGDNKLNVPRPASVAEEEYQANEAELNSSNDPALVRSKSEKFHDLKKLQQKKSEMYSIWCDALYRLSMANYYRDKIFWCPQNVDFRGRVYPLPPHLNHIGSDLSRCMFLFHEARPLGKNGFRWLKLHCINLTGLKKKSSVEERLQYAEEVLDDIIDSADHPLTGRMWWAQSDDPWQTLACCIEIANVSRSPDPTTYMCHFPIHQDGSCNGLQHYAALGRDQVGAISVNLSNMPRPQDVYLEVASKVEDIRKTDAANGLEIAQILDGFITRKVIKQTVMTTVYGVTRYGARLQIERQLKYLDDFPQEHVLKASSYLTTKTFDSLKVMFTSAKEIQDWFTKCAHQISAIRMKNMEWVTPLGLPVVQPYVQQLPSQPNNSKILTDAKIIKDFYEKPNMSKQKNAFPPNFIHSLDSTHMMLTSLNCDKAGITFVSVHDCFWTHPSTVAAMNEICRNQFVLLHSQPILEDLSEFFVQKYGYNRNDFTGTSSDMKWEMLNSTIRDYPKKGQFRIENVLDSVYFFS